MWNTHHLPINFEYTPRITRVNFESVRNQTRHIIITGLLIFTSIFFSTFNSDAASAPDTFVSYTTLYWIDEADSEAKNWSQNATLIQIGIYQTAIYGSDDGDFELATQGWFYSYRDDDNYLSVQVGIDDYQETLIETEELTLEEADEIELLNKTPLIEWEVLSYNALQIAFDDYSISFEQNDEIGSFFICMEEVKGIYRPSWHISIVHGTTGAVTYYFIDATNGDIL